MVDTVQIVTANRLADGEVVYQTAGGEWVEALGEAERLAGKAAAETRLAAAGAAVKARLVVNPYIIDVATADLRPLKVREAIRAAGPTVRRDLGKQAQG